MPVIQPNSPGLRLPAGLQFGAIQRPAEFRPADIASILATQTTDTPLAQVFRAAPGVVNAYIAAQQQQGLQNVAAGKPYNSDPGILQRIGQTIGHTFSGTLGQHANDAPTPSFYDRATPIVDPITGRQIAVVPPAANITAGPDGMLKYDPNRGLGLAQAGMSFRQAGNAAEMSDLQLRAARDAEAQRKGAQTTNIFDRAGSPAGGPDVAIPVNRGPQAPSEAPQSAAGKVTSYGYRSDPYGDSASLGVGKFKFPTGAWSNPLGPESMAVSPDVEAQFRAAGVKPMDPVRVRLADGTEVIRRWDDRTAQDDQIARGMVPGVTKPLRGRFDFYNQSGPHPMDGARVVGWSPINGGGQAQSEFDRPTPDVAPAQAEMQREAGPLSGGPVPEPSFNAPPPQVGPLSGGVAGGPGAQYPLSGEGIAAAVQDQGPGALEAAGGPFAVPRMSTAVPKGAAAAAAAKPPAGAQKAADQAVGLQEAPDQITLVGRYGYDSQGNRKFVSNAELAALGVPPGNETRQVPKFYKAKVGDDEMATFMRMPDGKDKEVKRGSVRTMTGGEIVAKYKLPEEMLDEVIGAANGSVNLRVKMENRAQLIRQWLDDGVKPAEVKGRLLFGDKYNPADPAMAAVAYMQATQKGKSFDGEKAARLVQEAREAGDEEGAKQVIEGTAAHLLESEARKRFDQSTALMSLTGRLRQMYEKLPPEFRGNDNLTGNSWDAMKTRLATFLGTKTNNPEFQRLQFATEGVLADLLSIRSGAAVTESEAARFKNLIPQLRNSADLSLLQLDEFVAGQEAQRRGFIAQAIGRKNAAALFGDGRVAVPGQTPASQSGASTPAAQPAGKPADPIPSVSAATESERTKEYNAIQSGALYKGPDGQVRRKP